MGAIEEAVNYSVMKELIDLSGVERIPRPALQLNSSQQFGICERLIAMWRYIRLCQSHKVKEHWNFSDFNTNPVRMTPLDVLIKDYHLDPIKEIFEVAFKSYGYGEFNKILSGTAFSYLDTSVVISSIVHKYPILKTLFGRVFPAPVVFLKQGFQRVFQNLVLDMQKQTVPLKMFLGTSIY